MASFNVLLPLVTGATLAPSSRIRKTFKLLAPDVLLAHVDDALHVEQGRHGGGGHSVLAGAGLGDQASLAHPPGQQRLPDSVVDLVRAGVVEVLPLQVECTQKSAAEG